jgi:peptide methionine sulfoxide reductase MsrA
MRPIARSRRFGWRPIVTEIAPAPTFYRAEGNRQPEENRQRYFERSGQAACAATLQPAA